MTINKTIKTNYKKKKMLHKRNCIKMLALLLAKIQRSHFDLIRKEKERKLRVTTQLKIVDINKVEYFQCHLLNGFINLYVKRIQIIRKSP